MSPSTVLLLGAVLNLSGDGAYVVSVWRRRSQPMLVSWILWSVVPFLSAVPQLFSTNPAGAITPIAIALGPMLVVVAAVVRRVGTVRLDRIDVCCAALAVTGASLYVLSSRGWVGVSFAIATDALASVPTIRAMWRRPQDESPWAYVGCLAAGILALSVAPRYTVVNVGFVAYIVAISTITSTLVLVRVRPRRRAAELPGHLSTLELASV